MKRHPIEPPKQTEDWVLSFLFAILMIACIVTLAIVSVLGFLNFLMSLS